MLLRILSDPFAILLVVLFFGASIFVHELGHYLAARWRGLKIDRFSIGFGPRLFGWKDKRGVDWRVSLFPLGGYVLLPQMADMRGIEGDAETPAEQLPSISYTDKMVVSAAGAFFNVLFALTLGTVLWISGQPVSAEMETTRIGYIAETLVDQEGLEREGPARRAGLREGDEVLRIDGREVNDWEDLVYLVTTGSQRSEYGNPETKFEVMRNGEKTNITVFPILSEYEGLRRVGIAPSSRLIVGDVMENSPAQIAGLEPGDEITSIDGKPVFHFSTLSERIQEDPQKALQLTVDRSGAEIDIAVIPEKVVYNTNGDTQPMIGVRWERPVRMVHINPVAQITDSVRTTLRVLGALIHPRTNVGISNLSGPVGISYTLYVFSQIGLLEVLSIVVLININLAILNLLPIPVLDGGHMAFATIGKLRGKPVPAGVMASLQGAFMLLFLFVFVYVTFFDVGRVQRNETAISEAEAAAAQRVEITFSGKPQPGSLPDMD